MDNKATVHAIYEAFGRGDVPHILAQMTDDVDFDYGHAANPVPWLQPRRGPAAVGEFFSALQAADFQTFAPKEIIAAGNVVVALIDVAFTVRATGGKVTEEDEIHVWRFDSSGKVARFKHGVDTLAHLRAFEG